MRIKFLQSARANLDSIMEYLAEQKGEETAKNFYAYIRIKIDILRKHPHIGRQGRVYGTRELVIDKYPFIIPYRVKDGELQILRVFHTSQSHHKNGETIKGNV